jgi:hypothetical protein
MKMFCAVTVVVLLSGVIACGQSTSAGDGQGAGPRKSSASQFIIASSDIVLPQGFFLLIRKGREVGAIRFTSIEQGRNPGLGKATYESYFQGDGSGSFRSPNVLKRTGRINLKPLKGFHPFAFQTGNYKVKVGEWSFSSGDPRSLDMGPFWKKEKDYGYEFAPTSAQSVEEIDATDKRLRWFRYDTERRGVLAVSDLPK